MAPKTWFPEVLAGSSVILRRHVAANLAAFRRWYADPEIARLARYQEAPMRADEIERFFAARVVGTEALAMAIHEASTGRLIGSCAFSQLDADNGSALYHITIGEKDAWGQGYGTEATRLMLDHAFGTLGLHRIALFVFEFNERAIRAYRRCGFVIEGRSRESIWRDGRWWDELAMSVLESDWKRRRPVETEGEMPQGHDGLVDAVAAEAVGRAVEDGSVPADPTTAGGSASTGILQRTMRRWR
ncbi:MAG TPA: GNAT family protein [Candidatus Saccharimonadales bacterium]|nr:GNAT family protein [Candidatus Saccharimonadales bacterium]